MEYPPNFSEGARAALVAAFIRAQDAHHARKRASDGLFNEDESLKTCILEIFSVYSQEVIELGKKGVWKIDDLLEAALEGLRRITIEISYRLLGHGRFLEPGSGDLATQARLSFQKTVQWREFETQLFKLANSKAQKLTSGGAETGVENSQDWLVIRDKFLDGARQYPDVSAVWEPGGELWRLLKAPAESERLFAETARLAIRLLRFSSDEKIREQASKLRRPWQVWLDLMREHKHGFQSARRPRRHWRSVARAAELAWLFDGGEQSSRIGDDLSGILQVFKESAEFCEEFTLRDRASQSLDERSATTREDTSAQRNESAKGTALINLTAEQKALLRLLVSNHEEAGGAEFFLTRSLTSAGVTYQGGPSIPITHDDSDFKELQSEGLITFYPVSQNVYRGKPTQLAITNIQAGNHPVRGPAGRSQEHSPEQTSDDSERAQSEVPKLNVELISKWMEEECYDNKELAAALKISVRAVSSLRNDGDYHGDEAVTRLANLMKRDKEDLYLP